MKRICQIAVAVALCLSVGLHWGFLQTIAWAGMLVDYSRDATLTEAIHKTFDGQHPCKLCKLVNEGKNAEGSQKLVKSELKLEFSVHQPTVFVPPTVDAVPAVTFVHVLHSRLDPPPLPPPRCSRVTL